MPTLVIHGTNEGYISSGNQVSWTEARGRASGTVNVQGIKAEAYEMSVHHVVNRGFLQFDTSVLSRQATIVSAVIGIKSNVGIGAVVGIVEGSQSDPLVGTDFPSWGSTELSSRVTIVGNDASFLFELNASGLALINRGGVTKYCLREAHDLDNTDLSSQEQKLAAIYSEYDATEGNHPYMSIEYVGGPIIIFGGQ